MRAWRQAVLIVLVTASGLSACARATSASAKHTAGIDRNFCPRSSATVYVQNDNWLDVVIYAIRGTTKYRLGEVTGVQNAVFQIPEAIMNGGSFGVYADPIGTFDVQASRTDVFQPTSGYYTGDIPLQPG